MNFFRRWLWPRSTRSDVMSLYKAGMACAEQGDATGAMEAYTSAIEWTDAPNDVRAMALYNRALLFAAGGKTEKALTDLRAVMKMPIALRDVKLAARRRLERLEHRADAAIKATQATKTNKQAGS